MPDGNWAKKGERFILADKLADAVMAAAKVESFVRIADADPHGVVCDHPLAAMGTPLMFRCSMATM